MGRRNNKTSRRKKKKAGKEPSLTLEGWNFDRDAGPGCHIARMDFPSTWILEWESVDADDFDDEDEVPDIAVDKEEKTLSFCNISAEVYKVAYITVYETKLRGRDGRVLLQGTATDNVGTTQKCTTLIVLCPPLTFAHLCYIDLSDVDLLEQLDSDVQEWNRHLNPNDTHPRTIGFPLEGGPFRCTQGEEGQLTHFFAGNLHAIDFACPVGTTLLAVADGVVVDVLDENRLTGIAVRNLFSWNSILLKLDPMESTAITASSNVDQQTGGPLYVEYVHIEKASVQIGDRVQAGQRIGTTGSVGFSPEPHLHFAAYRSQEPTAATVRVFFHSLLKGDPRQTFIPRSGSWYNANGQVDKQETNEDR